MRVCACGCGASLDGQKPSVQYASRACMEGETPRATEQRRWTLSEREALPFLRLDPCSYCGGEARTIDHIDALHAGGAQAWENLTAACRSCNASKGTLPLLHHLLRGPPAAPSASPRDSLPPVAVSPAGGLEDELMIDVEVVIDAIYLLAAERGWMGPESAELRRGVVAGVLAEAV